MTSIPGTHDDPYNLKRFVKAQEGLYPRVLAELRAGQKRSHWMWFIFPQIAGLGWSPTSRLYAIRDEEEARAYLEHPVLGERLRECAEEVLRVTGRSAEDIFGSIDAVKLRSCVTLFAAVSPEGSVFHQLLDRYYNGEVDPKTLELLHG